MMNQIIFTLLFCSVSFSLLADAAFEATVLHATDQDCTNGEISIANLNGYAPYEYVWIAGNDNTTISTTQSLTGLGEGLYCVTVTDALCGTASACFEIKCQECFSNDTQVEIGEDNVIFNIEDVSGISLPLNIQIVESSSGMTIDQININGSGPFELLVPDFQIGEEYCIVYLDDSGCTFSDCFIKEGNNCPDDIKISLVQINDASCGGSDASIEVSIDSDCEELAVYWNDDMSLTGPVLSDAEAGQHCVYVQSTSDLDCVDCFAVKCFDIYVGDGDFNTVCATINYAAGAECAVEDAEIETESCGETVTVSTGDNGVICVEIPTGECVELEMPNCDFGVECINEDDLVALREMILGLETSVPNHHYFPFIGDANGNSYISTLDIVYILRYILDLPIANSRVGDCVLFTPESIEVAPSNMSYTGVPNNELCDGDVDPEFLMGVIGDGDGSCNCELNDLAPNDGEVKLLLSKNDNSQVLSFEKPLQFYDCVITLSAPQLTSTEGLKFTAFDSESAHLAVDIKGDDLILTMHSKKKTPITLKEKEQFFEIHNQNWMKLNTESKFNYLIDKDLAVRPITGSRESKNSLGTSRNQLFTVVQKMLLLNELEMGQPGKIRILAMDGRVLYHYDFENYESIDLSHWGNQVLIVQYLSDQVPYHQVIFNY